MNWTIVNFGKFRGKGKTLPQIMFIDPDWFFYQMEQNAFKNKGVLEREAEAINYRAQHIKIPSPSGKKMVAEYFIHPSNGKFATVEIVPETRPPSDSRHFFERSEYLDMSIPRSISKYDKLGNELLIRIIKSHFFEEARVTKKRAEEFFNNPFNFYDIED
jgi:hypothetical protein